MEQALAEVIRRTDERLLREAAPEEAAMLLSAAYVLTGLRVPREMAHHLFQGVRSMRESTTYQAILDEGRQEGLQEGRQEGLQEGEKKGVRQVILRVGRQKIGAPSDAIAAALMGVTDMERLERMADRILVVSS